MVYDALLAYLRFAAHERHNWPGQGGVKCPTAPERSPTTGHCRRRAELRRVSSGSGLFSDASFFVLLAVQIATTHRIAVDEQK